MLIEESKNVSRMVYVLFAKLRAQKGNAARLSF